MSEWIIHEHVITPEDYNRLRASVGWGTYPLNVIARSLPHSLYCVCAWVNGQLVGMARIIGDDGLVFYIQDVIVERSYQGQGIGTCLMENIMEYIRAHANHNSVVGLMSAMDREPFYEKFGFARRPNDNSGAGMTIFWKEQTPTALTCE